MWPLASIGQPNFAGALSMNLHDTIVNRLEPERTVQLDRFIDENIDEFVEVVNRFPGDTAKGGISNIEAFWLFFMVRSIKPRQIIESGTFYGYSLHFLVEAAPAGTPIFSFDIDQSKAPAFPFVRQIETDWSIYPDELLDGDGTLIFFDDHIDQDVRLDEARRMGQQHIFFHDNDPGDWFSHRAIRFCGLGDAHFSCEMPNSRRHPIFTDTTKNAQTYRNLTYIERPVT